jgi:hypothetical protein
MYKYLHLYYISKKKNIAEMRGGTERFLATARVCKAIDLVLSGLSTIYTLLCLT